MRGAAVLCSVVLAVVLQGCASPQLQSDPKTTPVVPLHEVIGSLKCGLAKAIYRDRTGRTGLLSGVAKVTLKVNVVEGRTLSGGASVGIPVATGASLTPGFTASNDRTLTNNSEIHFNIDMSAANLDVCNAPYAVGHDAGFSGWIGQVVSSLDSAVAGAPKVSMQSYEYDSDFVVVKKAGLKLDFEIVPVKGNASYDSSRSDIQHLNIKIDAVHIIGGKVIRTGGAPFGTIPSKPEKRSETPEQKPNVPEKGCVVHRGGKTGPGGKIFQLPPECL
ncbi:hypothetical protein LB533_03395 [Mesorhizobium sp. BR1-1-13]|uniref:hypothetical protein n=1 Tax=Mesorhizobium sp. BR1-1-13 TaxID=2876656 RepID=UPI001CD129FD|nr:hypothetical protein [Mesorhizobium sp. BR1-1-13]MBZ9940144.1 hypothetical protein [Mesorhizobium sp. BR1-1-13]